MVPGFGRSLRLSSALYVREVGQGMGQGRELGDERQVV